MKKLFNLKIRVKKWGGNSTENKCVHDLVVPLKWIGNGRIRIHTQILIKWQLTFSFASFRIRNAFNFRFSLFLFFHFPVVFYVLCICTECLYNGRIKLKPDTRKNDCEMSKWKRKWIVLWIVYFVEWWQNGIPSLVKRNQPNGLWNEKNVGYDIINMRTSTFRCGWKRKTREWTDERNTERMKFVRRREKKIYMMAFKRPSSFDFIHNFQLNDETDDNEQAKNGNKKAFTVWTTTTTMMMKSKIETKNRKRKRKRKNESNRQAEERYLSNERRDSTVRR